MRLWNSKGSGNLLRINYVSLTNSHTQRFAVTVSFSRKLLTLRQLSHGQNIYFYFDDVSTRTSSDTASTWFVVSLFAVMILGNLPPLSMIEGAFLKYFGIPVAFTWFMSTKTFDGKKPYGFLKSVIAYALRRKLTYAGKKVTLGRNQPQEAITAVRSEFYGISN